MFFKKILICIYIFIFFEAFCRLQVAIQLILYIFESTNILICLVFQQK